MLGVLTLVARRGVAGDRVEVGDVAVQRVSKGSSTTTEDVSHDVRALRVAAKDELRVRAVGGILRDLLLAIDVSLVDARAVVVREVVVVHDVFVAAAREAIADGVDENALATGIGLVVALCNEDVDVFA